MKKQEKNNSRQQRSEPDWVNPDNGNVSQAICEQLKQTLQKSLEPQRLRKTSLAPYLECIKSISDGDAEDAVEVQADMCRSLHVMRILEKQLVYTRRNCKGLVGTVQRNLGQQKREDVHVKLTLLNKLVSDLAFKQALEEKYKEIIMRQESLLRRLEQGSDDLQKSEHSRISKEQVALVSDGMEDLDDFQNLEHPSNSNATAPKSLGKEDYTPTEQKPTSTMAKESNCWNEEFNASGDMDVLNAISSDSSDLFHSDSDSSDEEVSFQSPEDADFKSPRPWRRSSSDVAVQGADEIEEKNVRETIDRRKVKEKRQKESIDLIVSASPLEQNKTRISRIDRPRGLTVRRTRKDSRTPSTDRGSSCDTSPMPRKPMFSETDTVYSSDVSVVLEKAQSLADTLRRKSRENWEIDRNRKDRSPSIASGESKRPSVERGLSSHSVLDVLEKEEWGLPVPPPKPKRQEIDSVPTTITTGERNRPRFPRGLSSQGLLRHLEEQSWGSNKIKQADLYFEELDRPAEFRLLSSKSVKARKDRPVETAAGKA